jgi:hypothetical protein
MTLDPETAILQARLGGQGEEGEAKKSGRERRLPRARKIALLPINGGGSNV